MIENLHIDTAELDKLKGISIRMTDDDQPFLIFRYKKESMVEKAFPWIFWSLVMVLFCVYGFAIWWMVKRWM